MDSGRLSLDEPSSQTFRYPRIRDDESFARLTLRGILTHRTGLPNWARRDSDGGEEGLLDFDRPPNERFGYSGEGYQLLQAFFEARTGKTIVDLLALPGVDEIDLETTRLRGPELRIPEVE